MELETLKDIGEAPHWLTQEGLITLLGGYLLHGETPKGMYERVSRTAANKLNKPELEKKFFDMIWNNWLCPSTPIASNFGTEKGLPISCFGQSPADTTISIFNSYTETAMLTKYGGGIGKYWGDIRAKGVPISKGGFSEGIIPWLKIEESTIQAVSQSGVRRGASASYLPIEHGDAEEFIDVRRQVGDLTRKCLSSNFHHAVTITDDFIQGALNGDKHKRSLWEKLLKARVETGEPYITFIDNVNKHLPQAYINNTLKVKTSQLCNEIKLYNDEKHTFVCCLASLNLTRYDEWKNTDTTYYSIYFLDAVMQDFIDKAKHLPGFENSVRFSEKSRALGLGVLGYHTLLQSKMMDFDSYDTMMLNAEIFREMKKESERASKDLAIEYGEPEWCKNTGMRNTHLMAVAPTVSNSLISGGVSQGVEPIVANMYSQKSAKGTFIRKNPALEKLLSLKGQDTFETWQQINKDAGSVKNLKCLTDKEKSVFKTAREINQFAIVRQAGQRQKFIDQGQSVNLFFAMPNDLKDESLRKKLGKYIHDVHIEAWQLGVKGLYYLRPESVLKGDSIYQDASDCASCEA